MPCGNNNSDTNLKKEQCLYLLFSKNALEYIIHII